MSPAANPTGSSRPPVFGETVDDETRCVHYATAVDVIAIRFACCDRYYPCHSCHAESADHPAVVWPRGRWGERAVLCGVCGGELTIEQYRGVESCPNCDAGFNPRCRLHWDLYFEA
ncbi:putative CHY-type Zn-finger protein [Agromyces terreus]|uniref:CHY-type Zn-finger protein n=1 Tax=Agromyces terreus TaxID=424795 RepID=A0A9X2H6S7_9MICO|nr:CHY zinc finger protein [Agromyces terreus]MCP2370424.1 putative CHY-type Zn-finger protein [Agromyces terreus]